MKVYLFPNNMNFDRNEFLNYPFDQDSVMLFMNRSKPLYEYVDKFKSFNCYSIMNNDSKFIFDFYLNVIENNDLFKGHFFSNLFIDNEDKKCYIRQQNKIFNEDLKKITQKYNDEMIGITDCVIPQKIALSCIFKALNVALSNFTDNINDIYVINFFSQITNLCGCHNLIAERRTLEFIIPKSNFIDFKLNNNYNDGLMKIQ